MKTVLMNSLKRKDIFISVKPRIWFSPKSACRGETTVFIKNKTAAGETWLFKGL